METIKQLCEKHSISTAVYYKIAHKIKRRPTDEDIDMHIKQRKNGRPRKEEF